MNKLIVLVDHGLANSFDTHIEINEELLKDYPLFCYIVEHEQHHTNELFSIKDYMNEFRINLKYVYRLFKFIIKRPKTWVEFSPIQKRGDKLIYDINLFVSYLLLIAVITASLIFLI